MNRRTWNPAALPALPLDVVEPTDWDVVGLFDGTDEEIAARFAVMAACLHHRFRALTDRLDRAREWFDWFVSPLVDSGTDWPPHAARMCLHAAELLDGGIPAQVMGRAYRAPVELRNLMLGTTCRTQADAGRLLPVLADLPAAYRFVRVEPSEMIDLRPVCQSCQGAGVHEIFDEGPHGCNRCFGRGSVLPALDLVEIAGGPDQLRIVQAIGAKVLARQTWGPCPDVDCIQGAYIDRVPVGLDRLAPVCSTCNGDAQVMAGPALAIVAADEPTPGWTEYLHVAIPGHGARTWKQRPVGWWP